MKTFSSELEAQITKNYSVLEKSNRAYFYLNKYSTPNIFYGIGHHLCLMTVGLESKVPKKTFWQRLSRK